ncbi:pilus assembly PilX N-terminal domain-containing protein [Shewanella abyssi]|uniref:pilus assembly PilX family protein n=1 Tax=Shewanella abyssi TaxID=311789 RepID=UPI00200EDB50|nr:pilus assembly PilX N-terminal domain-containing protein [Shewanella abyssi]MCL1051238.1 pilus assembly PilX N-terminal domain-containing protein [Shewanella abyssi]
MRKQRGVVLFFSIIILLIMTVIGVALAVNSTQSIRMAGAGSERIEAMSHAHGAQDRLISSTNFTNLPVTPSTVRDSEFSVISTLTPLSDGEVGCVRSSQPDQVGMIYCIPIEVSSRVTFGRNGMGQLTVVSGIEQELK